MSQWRWIFSLVLRQFNIHRLKFRYEPLLFSFFFDCFELNNDTTHVVSTDSLCLLYVFCNDFIEHTFNVERLWTFCFSHISTKRLNANLIRNTVPYAIACDYQHIILVSLAFYYWYISVTSNHLFFVRQIRIKLISKITKASWEI